MLEIVARRAEIDQHRRAIGAHEDVVGRDIPMKHVVAVNELECIEQRSDNAVELVLCGRCFQSVEPLVRFGASS